MRRPPGYETFADAMNGVRKCFVPGRAAHRRPYDMHTLE